ncbi:Hypothetical predicted protein [Mytilus galloprovincialis]|uniref:Dermatopontin n=1 Tax=Mytilus galloprovincialis TaxID=29158 RepID=A0A8B6EBN9_MYTGA|nr:Hypothetical predicted protein [Mytilus galloprovincialis]
MLRLPIICLICTLNCVVGWDYVNKFDERIDFSCPSGQAISFIHSVHHDYYEDRKWSLGCRSLVGKYVDCYWTPSFVNDWDEYFNFECSHNGFITGIRSIHDNRKEDRRFMFKCCGISGKEVRQCENTMKNNFDKPNTVRVPEGSVVKGVSSRHSNYFEDREYSWKICNLVDRYGR